MALIKCPECGKEFSEKAAACPNCGCPTCEVLKAAKAPETDAGKVQKSKEADAAISVAVQKTRKEADAADKAFDRTSSRIQEKASKVIDLFGGDAPKRLTEIAADARRACDDLYSTYQTLITVLDAACRPLLADMPSREAVKSVADCIKYLNDESEIEKNFGLTFNDDDLGNVASAKYVPSMENKMIQKFWEAQISSCLTSAEIIKKYGTEEERTAFMKEEQKEKKRKTEEAEQRRLEKKKEDTYRAWESEKKAIIKKREKLTQEKIKARNSEIMAQADKIKKEYDSRFGESIRKRSSLENEHEETRNNLKTAEKASVKPLFIFMAIGIGSILIGVLCLSASVGVSLLMFVLGGLLCCISAYVIVKNKKKLSDLKKKEETAEQELAAIPEYPDLTQFAEDNKDRFNVEALQNESKITKAEEQEIRKQIEKENPIPLEPPKPASLQRSSYSSSNLTPQQIRREVMKEAILDALRDRGSMTISDMLESIPELEDESSQSVSAVCRQLVLSGKIERYSERRMNFFRIS